MKKLIFSTLIAFTIISCNNDDNNDLNTQYITTLNANSEFVSLDKNEIPLNFNIVGSNDINQVNLNISFNGQIYLNGNLVNGNFTYNINDTITFKPNNFGRTTATVNMLNENFNVLQNFQYDFYTVDSNSQDGFVFINNLIQRTPVHFNGNIYFKTFDGSSTTPNQIELIVIKPQNFNLTIEQQYSILNVTDLNFSGNELLTKFKINLLEQNFGNNNFKFTFDDGQIINLPFNYINVFNK